MQYNGRGGGPPLAMHTKIHVRTLLPSERLCQIVQASNKNCVSVWQNEGCDPILRISDFPTTGKSIPLPFYWNQFYFSLVPKFQNLGKNEDRFYYAFSRYLNFQRCLLKKRFLEYNPHLVIPGHIIVMNARTKRPREQKKKWDEGSPRQLVLEGVMRRRSRLPCVRHLFGAFCLLCRRSFFSLFLQGS